MKKYNYLLFAFAVGIMTLLTNCKKGDSLSVPPAAAAFLGPSSGTYVISTPTTAFKIPVGLTTISSEDKTVTVSVTSPTGAVQGTHFNVNNQLFANLIVSQVSACLLHLNDNFFFFENKVGP